MTYISIKLAADNISEFVIGMVHSLFYVGFLIGSARSEKLIHRIGHIRAFAAFAMLYCTTVLLQGIFINPYVWMVLRFFGGIGVSALYIIIESWFLYRATEETRGKVLSIYMIAIYASQSLSQLFINIMPVDNLVPFLIIGILATISVLPVATTLSKSPEQPEEIEAKKSFLEIIRHVPIGFIGAFISGMILSAIFSFIPMFASHYALSVSNVMTITIAGGFILQLPIGYFSDIYDRRKVLLITSFLLIVPSLLTMFMPERAILVYIFSFLLGGFAFTLYPLSISHVCDRVESIYITYVTGLLSVVYGVGAILGPLLAPLFMKWINPAAIYLFISTCAVLLGLITLYIRMKRPRPTPKYDKVEYMPMAGNTPLPKDLDPRPAEAAPSNETSQDTMDHNEEKSSS